MLASTAPVTSHLKYARCYSGAVLTMAIACAAWVWVRGLDHRPEAEDSAEAIALAREPRGRGQPLFQGYDLSEPHASFELPTELTEISALTDIDEHTVACVQDEIGSVFFIDIRTGTVIKRVPFGPDGDYEGLTRVANALWVLRSDGLLIELALRGDSLAVRRQVKLDLEHQDIEGLGYDPAHNLILVAPKSTAKGTKAERVQRRVFTVDPATGKRLERLALDTTTDRVLADAENAGIRLPARATRHSGRYERLKVRFASIAVHPRTDHLIALSAVDGAILAFTRDGTLVAAHIFDPGGMPKPEGITFLENGDMVVASEGVDSSARLHVFRYREGGTSGKR